MALKKLLLVSAATIAAAANMSAWVADPDGSSALQSVAPPPLGALHAAFEGLPSECELLIDVAASSVNPVDPCVEWRFLAGVETTNHRSTAHSPASPRRASWAAICAAS